MEGQIKKLKKKLNELNFELDESDIPVHERHVKEKFFRKIKKKD